MKAKQIATLLLSVIMGIFCFSATACDKPPEQPTELYTVSVINDEAKGTVTGITDGQQLKKGDIVTVSVIAKEGFSIESIKWGNSERSITNPNGISFTETIEQNVTLQITYSSLSATVSVVNDEAKGTVTGITDGKNVTKGTYVSVRVQAKSGYKISAVNFDFEQIDITNVKDLFFSRQITKNSVITITYASANPFISIINDYTKGTVTGITDGQEVEEGSSVTISITAKENYKINAVVFARETITLTNQTQISFTRTVSADATLAVTYVPVSYVFQIQNDSTLGTVTGATNGDSYEFGSKKNITVSPNTHFGIKIKSVTFNGSPVQITNQNGFTFEVSISNTNLLSVQYEWDAGWTPNA